MEIAEHSVDEFLAGHPDAAALTTLDQVIVEAAPHLSRRLWTGAFWGGTEQRIIGYGDIEQPRPRGKSVRWFLLGLARQKNYLSLYVNAVEDGRYLAQDYGPRLGRTKLGSASVSFRAVGDIDLAVLRELVEHSARTIA
ncbi:DUF1801 domain-containing protein [Nocardia sp. NPDC048505]|uniref:DUF1801 domain-containing protein n=1 Tax=unclassified Nocardia TaxID=2637762 RepID=UPI0033C11793